MLLHVPLWGTPGLKASGLGSDFGVQGLGFPSPVPLGFQCAGGRVVWGFLLPAREIQELISVLGLRTVTLRAKVWVEFACVQLL